MNIQDWFPLGWTVWISLLSKGLSRVFSSTAVWKHQFFGTQPSLWFNSHIHTWNVWKNHTGKTIALTLQTFVDKVMSLLFKMLSRFLISFLPRSKCLLIFWLQSPSTVILEPKKINSCHYFHFSPFCLPWSDGTGCHNWHQVQRFISELSILFHCKSVFVPVQHHFHYSAL